jgi:hypothetical protein
MSINIGINGFGRIGRYVYDELVTGGDERCDSPQWNAMLTRSLILHLSSLQ